MPTLPAELWWNILRLAVHIPGLFDTTWDYSPDLLMWTGWEIPDPIPSYLESLQTKLSVCLVSKSWREIGVVFLYEHLLFTGNILPSGVLSKLIAIFEQHAGQSGYGRSTKRIDILSHLFTPWFQPLLRLLELCSNVRIFNVSYLFRVADNQKQYELYSLLQTRFSHSLRRMKLCHHPNHSFYLPNVPLEALELSTGFVSIIDRPPATTTVSTLCLNFHFAGDNSLQWQFPALRHLTISSFIDNDMPFIESFLSTHGPQLLFLHLATFGDVIFTSLPQLLAPITNLRCLVLSPHKVKMPPPGNSFRSITHIGIQSPNFFPNAFDIEEVILGSVYPGLQCVRILDYSNPLGVLMGPDKDNWVPLLEVAIKRNIRFEDKMRRLIQI